MLPLQKDIPQFDLDAYHPTPVIYQLRASILHKLRHEEDPLPDIQGREETKKDVLRALLSGHNLYLISEEGTGKTRLAKSIAKLLPSIPVIKGCFYNDDPKWPKHLLCPRCQASKDPVKEFGIEFKSGDQRFSRIQGNDYTDESKLLGLKDIHAIVGGKSPVDPSVFAATGVFRANRGLLFLDELPSIRSKIQVLLHPITEEKLVILEEYGLEHPLDLILIATGNPQSFAHLNEVPRPLLDRLEMIYMPLPDKDVEREIMLQEKFVIDNGFYSPTWGESDVPAPVTKAEIKRDSILPWWNLYVLNAAIDHSRCCSLLDRKPSIRASARGLDHSYASAELNKHKMVLLSDVCEGLKLALRGRIELRPDKGDPENAAENFRITDEVSEDLLWNAVENLKNQFLEGIDEGMIAEEIASFPANGNRNISGWLQKCPELKRAVDHMKNLSSEKVNSDLLNDEERQLLKNPDTLPDDIISKYDYSAVEVIYNAALHKKLIAPEVISDKIFIPKMVPWAKEE